MGMLDALKTDETIKQETDSVGGFAAVDSDIYDCKIEKAFISLSTGKAMALNLVLVAGSSTITQQLWMTSGEAKGCKNYYMVKVKKLVRKLIYQDSM